MQRTLSLAERVCESSRLLLEKQIALSGRCDADMNQLLSKCCESSQHSDELSGYGDLGSQATIDGIELQSSELAYMLLVKSQLCAIGNYLKAIECSLEAAIITSS